MLSAFADVVYLWVDFCSKLEMRYRNSVAIIELLSYAMLYVMSYSQLVCVVRILCLH